MMLERRNAVKAQMKAEKKKADADATLIQNLATANVWWGQRTPTSVGSCLQHHKQQNGAKEAYRKANFEVGVEGFIGRRPLW